MGVLFAGIARSRRASGASVGGRLEFAAASPDAKRGHKLLEAFVPAISTGDIFFSTDGNKGFKLCATFFAQKFVNRHDCLL